MFAMFVRFAWVFLAATATMSSVRAADLIEAQSASCNCDSNMITIYDVEPGVVTRHWAECVCRYEPNGQRLQHIAAPVGLPDSVPFMDPWRRW
jgi:hypothetical protein